MEKVVMKRYPCEGDLSEAVSTFYTGMAELRDELQEVLDNMEGAGKNLESTPRYQALEEAKDTLEQFCDNEPEIPDAPEGAPEPDRVQWTENRRRGVSRSQRRDSYVNAADAAYSEIEDVLNRIDSVLDELREKRVEPEDEEKHLEKIGDLESYQSELETLRDELDEAKSAAEEVVFPGMYG